MGGILGAVGVDWSVDVVGAEFRSDGGSIISAGLEVCWVVVGEMVVGVVTIVVTCNGSGVVT